jgi:hypothetical protein
MSAARDARNCFASSVSSTSYLAGQWKLRREGGDEGSYDLKAALRGALDLYPNSQADICYNQRSLTANARIVGVPAPTAIQLPGPNGRAGWEWIPSDCNLALLKNQSNGCPVLAGKTILFVGDSVLFQVFLSFVLQMGATFVPNPSKHLRNDKVVNVTSTVCATGPIHFRYLRSDLLNETRPNAHPACVHLNRTTFRCDNKLPPGLSKPARRRHGPHWRRSGNQPFMKSALSADVVVLGTGHHFHDANGEPYWQSFVANDPSSLLERILTNTLSQLVAGRARDGRPSTSLVLMSPTTALPGCHNDAVPIEMNEALSRLSRGGWSVGRSSKNSIFAGQWSRWRTHVLPTTRAIATAAGVSYLDISSIAATRPDMHLGTWRRWDDRRPLAEDRRDCVHYCLPGPPDTFARLLFNQLQSQSQRPGGGDHA